MQVRQYGSHRLPLIEEIIHLSNSGCLVGQVVRNSTIVEFASCPKVRDSAGYQDDTNAVGHPLRKVVGEFFCSQSEANSRSNREERQEQSHPLLNLKYLH